MSWENIDLSKLPAPKIIEELSFEKIFLEWKNDLKEICPELLEVLDLESEPVVKLMQVGAFREMILRQRVNDAAKAILLAYAIDEDLDNIAALVPVKRKIIKEADTESIPATSAVWEGNEEFRKRIQMAPEGFSTAGPEGAYKFYALKVPEVRDVVVTSPAPCEVMVTILGREGRGVVQDSVLKAVDKQLTEKKIRPLSEKVMVRAAEIKEYEVSALITIHEGPSSSVVLQNINKTIRAYIKSAHVLGAEVTLSGLYASLHQEGVLNVELRIPSANVICLPHQAPYCTRINLEVR